MEYIWFSYQFVSNFCCPSLQNNLNIDVAGATFTNKKVHLSERLESNIIWISQLYIFKCSICAKSFQQIWGIRLHQTNFSRLKSLHWSTFHPTAKIEDFKKSFLSDAGPPCILTARWWASHGITPDLRDTHEECIIHREHQQWLIRLHGAHINSIFRSKPLHQRNTHTGQIKTWK